MEEKKTNPPTSHIEAIFNLMKGEPWYRGDDIKKNVVLSDVAYTVMIPAADPSVLSIFVQQKGRAEVLPVMDIKLIGNYVRPVYSKETVSTTELQRHVILWGKEWRESNQALPKDLQATVLFPTIRGESAFF